MNNTSSYLPKQKERERERDERKNPDTHRKREIIFYLKKKEIEERSNCWRYFMEER